MFSEQLTFILASIHFILVAAETKGRKQKENFIKISHWQAKKKEITQELVHLICQIFTQNLILERSTLVAAFRATALKKVFLHRRLFLFGKAYFSNEQLDEHCK